MFFLKCVAISPDYYSDKQEESNKDTNYHLENRRQYDNSEEAQHSNITLKNTYQNSESEDYNDDLFEEYVATQKSHKKKYSKQTTTDYRTKTSIKPENSSKVLSTIPRQMSNTTDTSGAINIFQDYEYIYDEDYSMPYSKQLREKLDHKEENRRAQPQKHETNEKNQLSLYQDEVTERLVLSKSTQQFDNKTPKYLPEFFNLEPAAGVLNYKKGKGGTKNERVWYVPEKFPCWDMPVIYGELGLKKTISNIFIVYASRLKNVIDENPEQVAVPSNDIAPNSEQIVNKWCEESPCYGDHTLCLFSHKTYSQICEKNYRVYPPTMSEQISLVNTLNSMRNSVAKGTAEEYLHLPPAGNMKQMTYDFDLEEMAEAWLQQCLPGLAPCSSLDDEYIMQLECTKYAKTCCVNFDKGDPSINW